MSSTPSAAELALLREEEALCARLLAALAGARARGDPGLPSAEAPCFGHLAVRLGERTRHLLIGERRLDLPGAPLLDWRGSPLAAVFLSHPQGEEFELDLDDRALEGTVLLRLGWRFAGGALAGVDGPERSFGRAKDGTWRVLPEPDRVRLLPGERGQRQGLLVPDAQLDPAQRRVLEAPAGRPLLVEGPAGSGKTTACLRRVARLHREGPATGASLVVVPEPGLAQLAARALLALSTPGALLRPFQRLILELAAGLPELPRTFSEATPRRVRRFKRHPALLAALPAFVEALGLACAGRLDHALFARGAVLGAWEQAGGGTLFARLVRVERALRRGRPERERTRIHALFSKERRGLLAVAADREALWQDRAFLKAVAAGSGGELGPDDVQAVLDHAWLQASERSEDEHWYVDPARLRTLDGQAIDAGTPREVAATVDLEDLPVLLALRLLKVGRPHPRAGRHTWTSLLVDEHQERAAVELFALGGGLLPGGALCLSGDPAQRVDESARANAPEALAALFGRGPLEPIRLRLSHRSTRPIAAFAHALLGPLAGEASPEASCDGPPVRLTRHACEGEALAALIEALAELGGRTETAVICRDPSAARRLHTVLDRALPATLALEGEFGRAPLVVTAVGQVGGMEFDTVVIPDADTWSYPDEEDARRRLYVAATRARRQLWVQVPGEPSAPLPGGG